MTCAKSWSTRGSIRRLSSTGARIWPVSRNAISASVIELLGDIVGELLGCDAIGLRVARIDRAMCPGWHVDHTGIRLVCTYQGPGTEWLDAQDVDRRELPSIKAAFVQATPGEIVLLKGSLWQDNEAFGAVHRSPAPSPVSLRTLVTLDPLWDA